MGKPKLTTVDYSASELANLTLAQKEHDTRDTVMTVFCSLFFLFYIRSKKPGHNSFKQLKILRLFFPLPNDFINMAKLAVTLQVITLCLSKLLQSQQNAEFFTGTQLGSYWKVLAYQLLL